MITDEQRRERINYIGSSDAAKVVGMSTWGTPLSVWVVKTGQLPEEDVSQKLKVKVGTKMEAVIAELFEEQTGKKVRRVNETIYHPKHSFIAANIDRRIVGEDTILEIKSTSSYMKDRWSEDEIPPETIIQVYHQLAVTGMKKAQVCALIGNGDDLIIKDIERDEKVLNDLISREVSFWNEYVIPRVMPKLITKADKDTLDKLYPQAELQKEIILGDATNQLIESLQGFKADRKHLDGLIEQHENQLRAMVKENEIGLTTLYKVCWTNSTFSSLDAKLLKEEMPHIYDRFYRVKPTRRFSVKNLGGN